MVQIETRQSKIWKRRLKKLGLWEEYQDRCEVYLSQFHSGDGIEEERDRKEIALDLKTQIKEWELLLDKIGKNIEPNEKTIDLITILDELSQEMMAVNM